MKSRGIRDTVKGPRPLLQGEVWDRQNGIWESPAPTNTLPHKPYYTRRSTLPGPHQVPRGVCRHPPVPLWVSVTAKANGKCFTNWFRGKSPPSTAPTAIHVLFHWLPRSEEASLITFTNTSRRPLYYQSQKSENTLTGKARVAKTNCKGHQGTF